MPEKEHTKQDGTPKREKPVTINEVVLPLALEMNKSFTLFLQQNIGNRVSEDMINGLFQRQERIISEWAETQFKKGYFNVNITKG